MRTCGLTLRIQHIAACNSDFALQLLLAERRFIRQRLAFFLVEQRDIACFTDNDVNPVIHACSHAAVDIDAVFIKLIIMLAAGILGYIAALLIAAIAGITACMDKYQLLACVSIDIRMPHAVARAALHEELVLLRNLIVKRRTQHHGNNITIIIYRLRIQLEASQAAIEMLACIVVDVVHAVQLACAVKSERIRALQSILHHSVAAGQNANRRFGNSTGVQLEVIRCCQRNILIGRACLDVRVRQLYTVVISNVISDARFAGINHA